MKIIEIIEKKIGNVIEIEERQPMWKMGSTFSRNYGLIMEHSKANDAELDIPYARYLNIDWQGEMAKGKLVVFIGAFTKKWHFQVGIPISKEISSKEPMKYRYIENKKYVKTIHHGPYHKVGDTYRKMYNWAVAQQLSLGSESIEFYLNDPSEVKKESLETMVLIPIVR